MPPRQRREPIEPLPPLRTAKTPQARESQMIDLAVSLAERQLRDGTASAQVITTYLKLGTSREKLEQERLRQENALTMKKIEVMAEGNRLGELLDKAMSAFKSYSGDGPQEDYEDYREDPNLF